MAEQLKKNAKKLTLFALTWPIFIEMLLHMIMGNADTLMLSQYSDNAVAAVGFANQILFLIIVMFGFVATGTSILVAQNLGAKDGRSAREVIVVSLSVNIAFSLLLSLVLYFGAETFLRWLRAPEELMTDAITYLQIVGGFSFLTAMIMTVSAGLKSYGFTRDAMYVTIGMNILNIIGNYLFIFGPFGIPVLGVQGVAIATTVSRLVGFVLIIILLIRRIDQPLPFKLFFKVPKLHVANLLKIGIPSAGEHLAYNISQIVILYFIATMGTETITARIYTFNIMMFIFIFSVAIGQGNQILIGHQVGAKQYEKAYKTCIRSLGIAMSLTLTMALIVAFSSGFLLNIFTDNLNIIALSTTLLWITIILEPGRTFNLVVINALRAAGDVRFPVYMGIASMWGISVPLAYFLGIYLEMGLVGVWLAYVADEWFRGVIMLLRWRSRVWQTMSFVPDKMPGEDEEISHTQQ